MHNSFFSLTTRLLALCGLLLLIMALCGLLALAWGSSSGISLAKISETLQTLFCAKARDSVAAAIVWQVRLPRVVLAAVVGATLALGGLVFQALLRNPLAEPYILGVSGGSAIGAIIGILLGLSPFPGVTATAFVGSMTVLVLVLLLAAGVSARSAVSRDTLLLGGVMMNAFCGAVIMFLISVSQTAQVHHILFWLMGDFSVFSVEQLPVLLAVLPCFLIIFLMARPLNLLLLGRETAASLGTEVKRVSVLLLATTTLMVSIVVSQSGLVGFVGLVIPHIFRTLLGPDHRLLIPASILGGGSYMILCDLLARTLPAGGEMPVGIVTALVGAPLFIYLLWRSRR